MNYEELAGFVDGQFASGQKTVRLDAVFTHFMERKGVAYDEVEDAFVLGLMLDRFDYREDEDALVPLDAIAYGDAIHVLTEAAKEGQRRATSRVVNGSELEEKGPRKPRGPPRRKAGDRVAARAPRLPLESLRGIGPKRAEALKAAGYKTLVTLAEAKPEKVAAKLHVSLEQAETWVARARERIGEA